MKRIKSLFLYTAMLCTHFSHAESVVIPEPADQLSVSVSSNIDYDWKTDNYTYSYILLNSTESIQEINFFALAVGIDSGNIINSASPQGWRFSEHSNENFISWGAVEGIPNDYIDDGGAPPSTFQIKPGEMLSGFSVTSKNSPTDSNYYVQGYTKLPSVAEDVEELYEMNYEPKHFTENSVSGLVKAPLGGVLPVYWGNRRPDVDGFLGLVNFDPENNVSSLPIKLHIRFSREGEIIDASSFTAILNNQDVTSRFIFDDSGIGDLVIELDELDGVSVHGKNVLILSVEGISPKNNKHAKDTDRIVLELL